MFDTPGYWDHLAHLHTPAPLRYYLIPSNETLSLYINVGSHSMAPIYIRCRLPISDFSTMGRNREDGENSIQNFKDVWFTSFAKRTKPNPLHYEHNLYFWVQFMVCSFLNRVFHKLSTRQKSHYCQLRFLYAIKNEQDQWSLQPSHLLTSYSVNKEENYIKSKWHTACFPYDYSESQEPVFSDICKFLEGNACVHFFELVRLLPMTFIYLFHLLQIGFE